MLLHIGHHYYGWFFNGNRQVSLYLAFLELKRGHLLAYKVYDHPRLPDGTKIEGAFYWIWQAITDPYIWERCD